MMALCVFGLCGCANVSFNNIVFSDGSIAQQLVVKLDKNEITSAGMSVDTVKNDIVVYAITYYNALVSDFTSKMYDPSVIEYVRLNRQFDYQIGDNYVNIVLKFNTMDAYEYFYFGRLLNNTDSNGVVTDHGFYQKDATTSQSVYYNLAEKQVAQYWLSYFAEKMPTVSFADCTYDYTYSTPYEKIHSDANQVAYDEYGNVSHTWKFKASDLTGENATTGGKITLYTIGIKTPLWYIVGIGATALLIVGLYVFCAIKDKKKAVVDGGAKTDVEIK